MKILCFTSSLKLSLLSMALCGIVACSDSNKKIDTSGLDVSVFLDGKAEQELNQLMDKLANTENIENAIVFIDVPKHNFRWYHTFGIGDASTGQQVQKGDNFRTASIGKMLTATRIMQLVELGLISLDQPIDEIFTDNDMPLDWTLSELSVVNGKAVGHQITVRQLLNHHSGVADYLFGAPSSGVSLPEAIVLDVVGALPTGISKNQWNADSLLSYYFQTDMYKMPYGMPGEEFNYTDTNYLLLGKIIEKVTATSLANNYREGIYSKADMPGAYLEWYEINQSALPIDHFVDASSQGLYNINFNTSGINTSMDWGGGGIVTNAENLNHFLVALFKDNKLVSENTLAEMKSFKPMGEGKGPTTDDYIIELNYGLGVMERVYKVSNKRNVRLYGHEGYYGTYAYYEPSTHTTIVLALNQVTAEDHWLGDIIKILNKAKLFGL